MNRTGRATPSRSDGVSAAAILDASPSAIVAVDEAGHIVYVNDSAETVFGYARDEILGGPVERLLPERFRDQHVDHRREYITAPVARPMGIGLDLAARRKNGTLFPVEVSLAPVRLPEGLRVFATVVDVASRKSIKTQLLQAQKLESIGRLAGGIAHDLNNMLFAIRGYVDLLTEDLADPGNGDSDTAKWLGYVGSIGQAAERASDMTAQLLAFSRRQVVRPRVLEMNSAAENIESLVCPLIGPAISLSLRLDPEAGRIRADPGQLDQIIVNLVVNARDALPGGGQITIETANVEFDERSAFQHGEVAAGRFVQLIASDNGVGMDAETVENIFEPFYTTKALGKGTGLGLSTIYGIVHQAGGHISVYSEPGHGSTFKIYFPHVDSPAEKVVVIRPAAESGHGRVLVVEDEQVVQEITARILERAGYEVTVVADGSQGLSAALAEPGFDVVVTDVIMPSLSGIDLADELLARRPETGVVLLSGYTEGTLDLARVTARGAVFLSKPASATSLLHAVRTAAASRRQGERRA